VVSADNTFAKDKMALNRMIGLAADQPLELTDTAPYADLAMLPLDEARQTAYEHRKDYLSLQAQVRTAIMLRKAAKYERYPTVSMDGYYGVLGVTHGLYHGVFNAEGSINIPVFHEAQFRGDREVADAQLSRLRAQIADLEVTIESQLRSSMLDVDATAQLVKVARSNVDLATQELADSNDRFRAGVEDNLPVVQAEATLADAQTQLVNSLYQYNQAKLGLARNTGIIESQYQSFLGK
jgi:outer membrane protein TolC